MSKTITVIGLGAGDLEQLPLGIFRILKGAKNLFLRTEEHPVVSHFEEEGILFTSFDTIYEQHDSFEEVYQHIVENLCSQDDDIVYAVPGHPLVAERTIQLLLEKAQEADIRVEIKGGQSFLDPIFSALKIDPIEGFQLLDGTSMNRAELQLTQHVLISQVYDQFVASDVKLTLMEHLPDEYPVYIVTAAGSALEVIKKVKLYELDREVTLSNLTTVYVPPVVESEPLYHQFESLRHIIATLRGPNGCPWDKKQTHTSLKKYLLEEAYELLEAIDNEDDDHIVEELGDVLLQVMLHAQIGEDDGMFSIDDVIRELSSKMVRRHPHVFSDVNVENAEEVVQNWNEIKQEEKGERTESILDRVPNSATSLMKAHQYQKEAAKVGFDWDHVEPMWDKVFEEIREFKDEVQVSNNENKLSDEFGDILFALVNVARYYKVDSESALAQTNHKFSRRFQYIENQVNETGKPFSAFTLEQLDTFWNDAKKQGL
ncbi:nucleoside triphosphate pyrophosphohydrolase [Metabacillus iocasae]|uniref:Tetrapyrrole methylase family protein/MazG family protein n=1 Tax=Priestia iocasae TaxID=2291674 RepID=A0ABS2R101_9BACI|nr:nucleoside triphosphate pyrophosphohydrolase [Metabacillus iocasae]MBM7704907.1 tetrapyrrole methylase family protein/MazG family protein [Metabacillus iocasae]